MKRKKKDAEEKTKIEKLGVKNEKTRNGSGTHETEGGC